MLLTSRHSNKGLETMWWEEDKNKIPLSGWKESPGLLTGAWPTSTSAAKSFQDPWTVLGVGIESRQKRRKEGIKHSNIKWSFFPPCESIYWVCAGVRLISRGRGARGGFKGCPHAIGAGWRCGKFHTTFDLNSAWSLPIPPNSTVEKLHVRRAWSCSAAHFIHSLIRS